MNEILGKNSDALNNKSVIYYLNILALFFIVLIVLYGSIARLTVVEKTVIDAPIRADAYDYFVHAKNLSKFSIYGVEDKQQKNRIKKDAVRAPGFPYFASLFYQGENMLSVQALLKAQTIVQCITFTILTVVIWNLLGSWLAVVCSLIIWTHPSFMSINTYYLTESVFLSSIVIIVTLFYLAERYKYHWALMMLLGIAIGISGLIRPIMNYYWLFLFLIFIIRFPNYLKQFWLAFLMSIIIAFSWKLRNYFSIGRFSDPTLMINALVHGSYPGFMYNNIPESIGFPYRFDPQIELYKSISKTLSLIWQRVVVQPAQYIYWYLFGKQLFLWRWGILSGQGDVFIYPALLSPINYQQDLRFWHHMNFLLNAPIMIIGIAYSYFILIYNLIKKIYPDFVFFISSIVVYASLFHIVVAPFPRYGIPFKVFVIITFCMFIKDISMWMKARVVR